MYDFIRRCKRITEHRLPELKSVAKKMGMRKYSKMNKVPLRHRILTTLGSIAIQRWFRSRKALNETCPISLDRIRHPCWCFMVESGWIYYNLGSLISSMLASGDFRDPSTRSQYSMDNLASMDRHAQVCGIKAKSLVKAKRNTDYYRRQRDREAYVSAISDQVRDIVSVLRDRIEDIPTTSRVEIELNLNTIYFPTLRNYIRILHGRNRIMAVSTINDSISFLENYTHTTQQGRGILRRIIRFLTEERRRRTRLL